MNNKVNVGGIVCDKEKAFDCVNHDILLSKTEFYGMTGIDEVLYKNCLNNRYQTASISNKHDSTTLSEWSEIKHGVPQGSILGPLLFFYIYMNDLPKVINNESVPILFTDDTRILFMHSSLTDFCNNICKVFEIANKWFKAYLRPLKFEKTQFIQFTTKPNMFPCEKIGYDNKAFPNVSHTKFLVSTIENTYLGEIIRTFL
jgi:hypothetical protein